MGMNIDKSTLFAGNSELVRFWRICEPFHSSTDLVTCLDCTRFQNYATEPKIATLTCQSFSYTITKFKLFKVFNSVVQYINVYAMYCLLYKDGFQDILVIIIFQKYDLIHICLRSSLLFIAVRMI